MVNVTAQLYLDGINPLAKHPTQPAGVPGGCGGSERRIRACYRVGCASHPIRVTEEERHKHICASS